MLIREQITEHEIELDIESTCKSDINSEIEYKRDSESVS